MKHETLEHIELLKRFSEAKQARLVAIYNELTTLAEVNTKSTSMSAVKKVYVEVHRLKKEAIELIKWLANAKKTIAAFYAPSIR